MKDPSRDAASNPSQPSRGRRHRGPEEKLERTHPLSLSLSLWLHAAAHVCGSLDDLARLDAKEKGDEKGRART